MVQEECTKMIDKLHLKQKKELLKLMHTKRKMKLRELQQKHRDKHEMSRSDLLVSIENFRLLCITCVIIWIIVFIIIFS